MQNRDGAECDLFRKIAEQGHYAGRTHPTDTRQGIYATTPGGTLLASVNTRRTERVIDMLEEALARWEVTPESDRYLEGGADDGGPLKTRWERLYPHDGMVLLVTSRDLPRERKQSRRAWKRYAWNHDYAWFRESEIDEFIPRRHVAGAMAIVPDKLVRRLARLHLVDNVRGQTSRFEKSHIDRADLFTQVTEVRERELVLKLDGKVRMVKPANPDAKADEHGRRQPDELERGIDVKLLGRATFDTRTGRFTALELVAIGSRWGATRYNGRERDGPPAGIGFSLTLANDDAPVAPAFVWEYGWRR